jgi:hypothetical protein
MHRRIVLTFLLSLGSLMSIPHAVAHAQIYASERALVAQTVDGTRLTVDYARPRARGRTNMYGGMEPWGRSWTPGADDATTLAVSRAITIGGKRLEPGRYSVWLVLREHEPWTFVLDPRDTLFHTAFPDSTPYQIRFPVTPETVAHTEVLTWSFPLVTSEGTTLEMAWGTRRVRVPITVTPTYARTVRPEAVSEFVGAYDYRSTDTTDTASAVMTIRVEQDRLMGRWEPALYGSLRETQLLTAGPDRFVQGWFRNGELWAATGTLQWVFRREGGRVIGFDVLAGDELVARATRRRSAP